MGNLIKDFWTYKDYYGINEVVSGSLEYRSIENKKETRVEKALQYTLNSRKKELSHWSIQKYNTYLNRTGQISRSENESAYYPFFIEFEPKRKDDGTDEFKKQYKRTAIEAYLLATFLIYEKGLEEKDLLILINNHRSIYIMINPVSYGLKPGPDLHRIYREMYNIISEEVSLKNVDHTLYKANSLMKTPNSWYNDGYIVPITYDELKQLQQNPEIKGFLTREKRSLDYSVPGCLSAALSNIYETAKENIRVSKATKAVSNVVYVNTSNRSCVDYILENSIEEGYRNHALVSVAYHYKSMGYTVDQIFDIIYDLAQKWNMEDDQRDIMAKAKSIYRGTKKFRCEMAQNNLCLEKGLCNNCKYNTFKEKKYETKFKLQRTLVNELWKNKASTRHYIALLQLSRKGLFNKWFTPKDEGLTTRTIKEMCNFSQNLIFTNGKDSVMVHNKLLDIKEEKFCLISNDFWDNGEYKTLGDKLKHFLKLLYTGYKSKDKYVQMRVGKERIQELLGYTTQNAVYKLVKKLVDLGFAVFKDGKLFSLYFTSYKIVKVDEYKERNTPAQKKEKIIKVSGGEPFVESIQSFNEFSYRIESKINNNQDAPDTG